MAKIAEAMARLYQNIFVCRKFKSKMRVSSMKVSQGKVKCRKCDYKALRPIKKK